VEQPTFSETAFYWQRQPINQSANWGRGLQQSVSLRHSVSLDILVFDRITGLSNRPLFITGECDYAHSYK